MHLRHPVWLLALIATAASAQHKGKTSWAEWSDAVARARQKLLAAHDGGAPLAHVSEPTSSGELAEVTAGCALDPKRSRCTLFAKSKELATARCDEAPVTSPDAPSIADRLDPPPLKGPPPVSCSIRYQAHVERHGYVCSVALIEGCGHAKLERTLAETVSRWRFKPAMKDGEPVAYLHVGGISVRR